MQHFELNGQVRKVGNKATIKEFRSKGLVPCNLYGNGIENVLFTVNAKELKGVTDTPKAYIVDLSLDNGDKFQCVLHELQFHPVSDECLHVDFLAISDNKPVAINVPIVITGHAVGVQKGGKFVQSARELRISALPNDLPDNVVVDITSLDLDKRIKAADIKLDKISVISDKDTIICSVRMTRNAVAAE